ncbi:MAG: hypothetical protein R3191_00205 [Anaerolineales bacterium]|nr:hypothetical protein [Anaerolineales bacterium]
MSPPAELQRAADLIRSGEKRAARELLVEFLRANPQSAPGWYLLSFTVPDRGKQRECLERALRLNPDMTRAKERLQGLTPDSDESGLVPQGVRRRVTGDRRRREAAQPSKGVTRSQTLGLNLSTRAKLGIGIGAVLFVLAGAAGAFVFIRSLTGRMSSQREAAATAAAATLSARQTAGAAIALPPTWTPTATPPPSATPTPSPTPSLTPTPSPIPPDPTTQAEMEEIQSQVSDLRGLPLGGSSNSYLITSSRVRPILEASFQIGGGTEAKVEDLSRVLVALGLIKPTYDLYTNVLNGLTDSLGGFYLPWSKQIFVIGSRFSGVERWVYSHEYTHALVDHHHGVETLGVYPLCERGQDECTAIEAVIEGDATLLMSQWLEQYATPQDIQDIISFDPPDRTLPDQFPPPYALPDGSFPYTEGLEFIEFMHARGNWARVDRVYEDLPDSTEQILHPQKYLQQEPPVEVQLVDLSPTLGEGWRVVEQDTLGEWTTFLLLAYGADIPSQIEIPVAEQAAAGWGGDRYAVYFHGGTQQTILVARWAWDTSTDGVEFGRALRSAQDGRFRGHNADLGRGDCWDTGDQVSCVLSAQGETLWLLAPSPELMTNLQTQFPGFE